LGLFESQRQSHSCLDNCLFSTKFIVQCTCGMTRTMDDIDVGGNRMGAWLLHAHFMPLKMLLPLDSKICQLLLLLPV